MNAYAVSMAQSANAMASQAGAGQTSTAGTTDISFANLLNSVLNTGTQDTGFTTLSNGIRWQDVQAGMMMEAMGKLSQAEQPSTADPMLAQLLNMLRNLMNGGDEGDAGELLNLVNQMMERLRQIAEENGGQLAGQEMMAIMNAMGQSVTPFQTADLTGGALSDAAATTMPYLDGTEVLQAALGGSPEDMLKLLTGADAETLNQLLSADAAQTATEPNAEATTVAPAEAPGQGGEDQAAEMGAEAGTGGEQTAPAAPTTGTSEAFDTLSKAYRAMVRLEAQPAAKPESDVDIDALQQRVDAGYYLQNTAMAEGAALEGTGEATLPLATQLTEGVQTAINSGNDQLVIRLNPEDLGEVTIRLTKTAEGNMALDIVAKNAETQRLLAGEVDALRETLKPLKVEVENILTEQQEAMLQYQQNPQQDRHNWQPMHGAAYYGDEPLGQSAGETAAQPVRTTLSSVLDTYI